MKIVLGADPFAYDLKRVLTAHLTQKGLDVVDADEYTEIPYFESASRAAEMIRDKKAECGILLCGTGAGVCIVANKFAGIQAVSVESVFTATHAKAINNANIITMGAMVVDPETACKMADAWLETKFTQGFENIAEFLRNAAESVRKIDERTREK